MIRSILLILSMLLLLSLPEQDYRYDTETTCWAGGIKCVQTTTANDSLILRKDGTGLSPKPIYEKPE